MKLLACGVGCLHPYMGRIRVDGPHKLVQVCKGVVFGGVSEQVGIVFFFFFWVIIKQLQQWGVVGFELCLF